MLDLDLTFVWTFVNFIILYVALRFILFKPLGKHMQERAKKIADNIASAERAKAEGEKLYEQYKLQLEETAEERRKILTEAGKKAASDAENYINNAKSEAAEILEKSRLAALRERETMIAELKDEIVSISIAAASKIMDENMDSDKNKEIAESFIERVGVK